LEVENLLVGRPPKGWRHPIYEDSIIQDMKREQGALIELWNLAWELEMPAMRKDVVATIAECIDVKWEARTGFVKNLPEKIMSEVILEMAANKNE